MNDNLSSAQFTLYRGEGSHERPSYYPRTGPDALAGAWYTNDLAKAQHYAASANGRVFTLDVAPHEAEPHGMTGNFIVRDPAVRARRTPHYN